MGGFSTPRPAAFPLERKAGTLCIGGSVGLEAGGTGTEKLFPYEVAIPTTLAWSACITVVISSDMLHYQIRERESCV